MKPDFYIRKSRNPKYKWEGLGPRDPVSKKRPSVSFKIKAHAKRWERSKTAERERYGTEGLRGEKELATFGKTPSDAIDYFISILKQRAHSCEVRRVFAEVVNAKRVADCDQHYIANLELTGRRFAEFAEERGRKLVCEIEGKDIEEFLATLPVEAVTKNHSRGLLGAIFNHAKKRKYCSDNPVEGVAKAKEVPKSVGVFEIDQLTSLLANAPGEIIPHLTVGAFAGVRNEEIHKLDWSEVVLRSEIDPHTQGYGYIHVPAHKAKTGRERYVPIFSNLAEWLRPFAKSSGPISPKPGRFDWLRREAVRLADIQRWPHNGARHSFASYHHAYCRDLVLLADLMGNSPKIILKHYRKPIRPEDARPYWKISPSQIGISKIRAFKPEGYWWCHKVDSLLKGEWIEGVADLADYYGVVHCAVYIWFRNLKAPPRPEKDRFHEPTWTAYIKGARMFKAAPTNLPYYVSWRSSASSRESEKRKYFATESEAQKWADKRNRELLAKEVQLENLTNVIEFTSTPASLSQSNGVAQEKTARFVN